MAARKKPVNPSAQKQRAVKAGLAKAGTNLTDPRIAGRSNRKMNALDKAISQGKTLPSKNKRVPGDTDVKMKGMKAKPVIKIKKK